jgi:pyrroloquinoline-quinone synthase
MPLAPDSFEESLWAIRTGAGSPGPGSFYVRFFEGRVSREELRDWAKEFYPRDFSCLLSAIHTKCPELDARTEIAENIAEEHGRFVPGKDHPALWRRFAEALGVTAAEVEAHERRPAARAFYQRLRAICDERPWVEGMAAVGIGIEAGVPALFSAMLPILRERYGLPEDALEFFDIHVRADEDHGRRAIDLVRKYATTDEQQAGVQRTLREVVEMTTRLWA